MKNSNARAYAEDLAQIVLPSVLQFNYSELFCVSSWELFSKASKVPLPG